ncbi:MAG: hypothetical protein ACPHYF_09275 [Akkermansiaceae bacterium]
MNDQVAHNEKPMSVGDWFVTILILAIPLVNITMYLVWAFSSDTNLNKKNFCRATLLWILIWVVLGIIYSVVVGTVMFSNMQPGSEPTMNDE